ncbi:hypothetical protein [Variovorax guangxiensis]|uniref:hypothetical protein n=1 Tax=Variovorax guangxiensis TaxID=1775474 RepID=UPI0028617074|nr:hypothetical protein [Variovorax guangxiensis]MDR6859937.1 hypothetical protein [Variovorax guangxiensis]
MSLRTLQRYQASGNAPRAAYLALWFESRWGMAALHAQAFNEAQHARAWVASLERECERLRGVIRALENVQGQAAANSAVFPGCLYPCPARPEGRRVSIPSSGRWLITGATCESRAPVGPVSSHGRGKNSVLQIDGRDLKSRRQSDNVNREPTA